MGGAKISAGYNYMDDAEVNSGSIYNASTVEIKHVHYTGDFG